MRRAPEPRGTLKLIRNIITDGNITDYTPRTIAFNAKNKQHTNQKNRSRNSNRNAPQSYQHHNTRTKTRLTHFVACKTLKEFNLNQQKTILFRRKKTDPEGTKQQHAPSNHGPAGTVGPFRHFTTN